MANMPIKRPIVTKFINPRRARNKLCKPVRAIAWGWGSLGPGVYFMGGDSNLSRCFVLMANGRTLSLVDALRYFACEGWVHFEWHTGGLIFSGIWIWGWRLMSWWLELVRSISHPVPRGSVRKVGGSGANKVFVDGATSSTLRVCTGQKCCG
jgi:hypothetical protein